MVIHDWVELAAPVATTLNSVGVILLGIAAAKTRNAMQCYRDSVNRRLDVQEKSISRRLTKFRDEIKGPPTATVAVLDIRPKDAHQPLHAVGPETSFGPNSAELALRYIQGLKPGQYLLGHSEQRCMTIKALQR